MHYAWQIDFCHNLINMKKNFDNDLHLTFDPEEKLRMENQLLELKLKAEFGAKTFSGGDIPAEVENSFLKNVLKFESSYLQSGETKICDILGNPKVKPEAELNDRDIKVCLSEVNSMLHEHNIAIDFGRSYDARTKYKFITEELFEECILQAGIPGMMMHFVYEEFHPDHKTDLYNKAKNFIMAWFEKEPDKILWELGDRIILPEGPALSKEKIMQKLYTTFSFYSGFSECKYVISEINFEISDDAGISCIEGAVSYNATINHQETIAIQGNFKLYFSFEYGWWDMFYFIFPGFNYP